MMEQNLPKAGIHLAIRHMVLAVLLLYVILAQMIPGLGEHYARHIYPTLSHIVSSTSMLFPFSVGDWIVLLLILGLLTHFFYVCFRMKGRRRRFFLYELEYLLWIYVWFYMFWGLNYSQYDFYRRTGIERAECSPENFRRFADRYVSRLNADYTDIGRITPMERDRIRDETVSGYQRISAELGIHPPFHRHPRVKQMLFSGLASKVGVRGSMAPFLCEFTLNSDVPPSQYAATYAHEYSHLLGIANEAEANFYAYRVCTLSEDRAIRFSGYFSLLPYVLSNARRLLDEPEYRQLVARIRPEVVRLYESNREYWLQKYSPFLGGIQDWFYDLFLRTNKVEGGRQSYSAVVGLVISFENRK